MGENIFPSDALSENKSVPHSSMLQPFQTRKTSDARPLIHAGRPSLAYRWGHGLPVGSSSFLLSFLLPPLLFLSSRNCVALLRWLAALWWVLGARKGLDVLYGVWRVHWRARLGGGRDGRGAAVLDKV